MIETAYTLGETLGLEVWCEDEAGPYQTVPQPGASWQPEGQPQRHDHEYVRNGTAKLLTLFRPCTGEVRVDGVRSCTNDVLHGWLKTALAAILDGLPPAPPPLEPEAQRGLWRRWQAGLRQPFTLRQELPPLRMLLVLDNLKGHTTPEFVCWCMDHGIMLLYTPLGGSWLNMAESIQRILRRRALDGNPSRDPRRDYCVVEGGCRRVEPCPHTVRLGWQARCPACSATCAPPRPRWFGSLHPPCRRAPPANEA